MSLDDKAKKVLLADLDTAYANRWGADIPTEARESALRWKALAQEYKTLSTDKQACSREFGEVKRSGGDLASVKTRMQGISTRLGGVAAEQKTLESRILELLAPEPQVESKDDFPARFDQTPLPTGSAPAQVVDAATVSDQAWDAYVASNPRASLYHTSAWRRMIKTSQGHRDISLAALDTQGALIGLLPLTEMQSRLFGHFAVSIPYFNYGGVLADTQAAVEALLEASAALGNRLGLKHVELRHAAPLSTWPERDNKVSMIRSLPDSAEALDAEVGSKIRAQIKRAEREGLSVRLGGSELLNDFYRVFAENMRDLGTPVYAKSFFRAVLTAQPDHSHLAVVYLNRRPVACAFLMGYREMLEIPWASTLRRVNTLGVNMYLYWQVLCFAIDQGYAYFDFGRSTEDAGTYRFKRQWGAKPLRHHWHYWLPEGEALPQLNPDNPKFRLMIAVWRRLPVWVTRWIGPPIVRNLP